MDEPKVLIVDDVRLSNTCLNTLYYYQENENARLKTDMALLKNILLYLAVSDPETMIPKEERLELIGKLAEFIVMIQDIKG